MPSYRITGSYMFDDNSSFVYKLHYVLLDNLIKQIDRKATFICVKPFEIIFTSNHPISDNYKEKHDSIEILGKKYSNLQFVINQV